MWQIAKVNINFCDWAIRTLEGHHKDKDELTGSIFGKPEDVF